MSKTISTLPLIVLGKQQLDTLNTKELHEQLYNAAANGDVDTIDYILCHSELKQKVDIHFHNDIMFILACGFNHIDLLKYLLISPNLKEHINIHTRQEAGLVAAIQNGHTGIVKYLLSSAELKDHADINIDKGLVQNYFMLNNIEMIEFLLFSSEIKIKTNNMKCLEFCCTYGHINFVKRLLTDPIKSKNLHNTTLLNKCLKKACDLERIDVAEYLLTSPDIKVKLDIHYNKDIIFKSSHESYNIKTLNYLILDKNIEYTEEIEQCLYNVEDNEMIELFEKRDFKNNLNKELNININKKFKKTIKI